MSVRDRYVDLKINGRLFPTWILANFKKYKLPDLFIKEGDDPCNKILKVEMKSYQQFLVQFLDYRSPFKDILIYHGLGSGKTATTINVYNSLYNYNPAWNVFLLIKASIHETQWLPELKKWLTHDKEYEYRMKNIIFIHYDSPTADKQFMDAVRSSDSTKRNMYIIDEAHGFISNVYSNINSGHGRRAQSIYDYIIQDKQENDGVRVILLSGTPAINNPYELALLFNLLRPNTFPKMEAQFNQLFTSHGNINEATKNMFQRRILGLVSYYIGATPDYYATKNPHFIDVNMSEYQTNVYNHFEDIENLAAAKFSHGIKGGQQTYRSYTRGASNFVFPNISQRINGELRPRPSKFKLTEREAELVNEGKHKLKLDKNSDKYFNIQSYYNAMATFMENLEQYLDNIASQDKETGHTLDDDIKIFTQKYNSNFMEFHTHEQQKSQLYGMLYRCSCKYTYAIFNILKSAGPVLVYSNYVVMEGLQTFKIYLKYFGFTSFKNGGKDSGKDGFRYVEYHGGIEKTERRNNLIEMNKEENKYGNIIKIIMISPAGSEGLNLMSIRQVHILEPYWHEVRITQMIGRAIRNCSHKYIPVSDRYVDIFRYKTLKIDGKPTTDHYIEDLARSKDRLINSFLDAIKEASIDCKLNYAHNKLYQDLKCFQFEEPSLFAKQIGPAFKKELAEDININNGSNSINAITIKIKVMKILAVKQLSKDDSNVQYSKPQKYWYNPETHIVYDFDLHYAIGEVSTDESGNVKKLDKETYIIDKIIPIPMIDYI